MASVLTVGMFMILMVDMAQSLTCYNCTYTSVGSYSNNNCGPNFNPAGVPTCQGASCAYAFGSSYGVDVMLRTCQSPAVITTCQDVSVTIDVRVCFCNTNLCNLLNPGTPNQISAKGKADIQL
jgi:hypothetical protein